MTIELSTVLASGDITDIKQGPEQVIDTGTFLNVLAASLADGIKIPEVESAAAENGSIFFDPTAGQIRYKSPAGILLRFRMQLV